MDEKKLWPRDSGCSMIGGIQLFCSSSFLQNTHEKISLTWIFNNITKKLYTKCFTNWMNLLAVEAVHQSTIRHRSYSYYHYFLLLEYLIFHGHVDFLHKRNPHMSTPFDQKQFLLDNRIRSEIRLSILLRRSSFLTAKHLSHSSRRYSGRFGHRRSSLVPSKCNATLKPTLGKTRSLLVSWDWLLDIA